MTIETIPTKEPTRKTAGDTWTWTRNLPDYLPASWTLTYDLVSAADRYSTDATDNGDDTHLVAFTPAATAAFTAGDYVLVGYVDDGTDRVEVYRGPLTIVANSTSAVDLRSHAKVVLDALQAVIEGRATHDQAAVSIRGRSISRMTVDELVGWRNVYRREYAAEVRADATASGHAAKNNKVLVRF